MATFLCADLTPSLSERALQEARKYRQMGKNRTALDRYATYLWLQRIFLNSTNDERERKQIMSSIKQAKKEREAITMRRVPAETGPLRSFKYHNWSLEGTHRQRLYTPAATGLYTSMHLAGPTTVEKKRYLQDFTDTLPCQSYYTEPNDAWNAHSLFNSTGLTNAKATDAVVEGRYRPENVYASLISDETRGRTC